jgi:multiple sugar transport system permease protein
MAILCFAAGTQLFVEPQVLAEASGPFGNYNWSPTQVAYQQAFRYGNFNEAAAILVILLVLGLLVAVLVIWRGKLFRMA